MKDFYALDTETKHTFQGLPRSDDYCYNYIREHTTAKHSGVIDFRANFEVKLFSVQISNGKDFQIFETIEAFIDYCCQNTISLLVVYNAKFDFAIFSDWLLRNNWQLKTDKGKATKDCYKDLVGNQGQRYALTLYKTYRKHGKKNCRNQRCHMIKIIDLCNIVGGGLAKNLEDWQITDDNGKAIRKTTMNYSEADFENENDLEYMRIDVDGLYYLTKKVDKTLKDLTGLSFLDGDYMTVGGMAKKSLLREMFNSENDRENVRRFKAKYPMTLKVDKLCRDMHLYEGGLAKPNEFKRGVVIHNDYVYDINSMYPDKMRNVKMPLGLPKKSTKVVDNEDHCNVVHIVSMYGVLKPNMIAIYRDTTIHDFVNVIDEHDRFMWWDEVKELQKWYDLQIDYDYCFCFMARIDDGFRRFVDKFYTLKAQSKGCVREACKKPLNSSYGKIAQKPERPSQHYELGDFDAIRLVCDGVTTSENGLMSIFVGSRITSMARVHLMQLIRDICKGNVKDNFNYCDTDSVHACVNYEKANDKELGKAKLELKAKYGLYIAPKTYILQKFDNSYVVHCKGVNTCVVERELESKSMLEAIDIFTANRTFKTLCGLNIKGGKALVYLDKMILREDNYRNQMPVDFGQDEGIIT